MLKRVLLGLGGLVGLVVLAGGLFVLLQVSAFDGSLQKKHAIALPTLELSTDAAALARGKHLAESFGGCHGCHGPTLAGGKAEDLGPLSKLTYPNITTGRGGRGAEYSDAELARLLKHGVRKDGTSARFMPSHEMSWWPKEDVVAGVSYMRSLPAVDGQPGVVEFSALAKVLDRLDMVPVDVARRIDHEKADTELAPAPAASI